MRNLEKDLEICNKYEQKTRVAEGKGSLPYLLDQDLDYAAAARQGWPEAIQRAMVAESEVERLKIRNKRLHNQVKERQKECNGYFAQFHCV